MQGFIVEAGVTTNSSTHLSITSCYCPCLEAALIQNMKAIRLVEIPLLVQNKINFFKKNQMCKRMLLHTKDSGFT